MYKRWARRVTEGDAELVKVLHAEIGELTWHPRAKGHAVNEKRVRRLMCRMTLRHLGPWWTGVRLIPPTESEFGDLPIAAPNVRLGSCVQPVEAVFMTAGPNAIRRVGSQSKARAWKRPDPNGFSRPPVFDRFCITSRSPRQTVEFLSVVSAPMAPLAGRSHRA